MIKKTDKKRTSKKDPFAAREASNYDKPIASREHILTVLEKSSGPMRREDIASALAITDEDDLEALRRRLRAMERDGQIIHNRRGGYGLIDDMDLVVGRIMGHADGFGFLIPDDGSDDLFISDRKMRSLMHGDRCVCHVSGIDRRGRREGAPVEILERANHELVGQFHSQHGISRVKPSNKRIANEVMVPVDQEGGAKDGQMVVVTLSEQPTKNSPAIGHISEILGDHMAPGMEIDIAARLFEIPREWPDEVYAEADKFGSVPDKSSYADREDIRDLPLVTIDGEDARDFDDAVYCERKGKGWRLLVAIADVSSYVQPGSALDTEAQLRGNSVYFPNSVIPMLPEKLSNGLCSINPDVDRLCMVCDMELDAKAQVTGVRFYDAVMRSHARLTYTKVASMVVDGDAGLRHDYNYVVAPVDDLYTLYKVFAEARAHRGAIDFETTETRIVFGDDRKIERIEPTVRNDAHRMIEEFMIAANVCSAKFLLENDMPIIYRVHSGPSESKLTDVREFLASIGLTLSGKGKPEPRHYGKLLAQVKDRPDQRLIQTVLLRSLSQAVYAPENLGHFGLSFDAYTHFTSPIRRYPDLLVHRAIRHVVKGGTVKNWAYSIPDMVNFGEHCSMTERRADEATRDAVDWLKCEYMMDKLGDEFEGMITAVTGFGIFVELDDIYVEGLVHITELKKDYYHFDQIKHELVGERSGRSYKLTGRVKIKVARVDLDDKKIDFVLADDGSEPDVSPRKKSKPKSKAKTKAKATEKKKSAAKKSKAEPTTTKKPRPKRRTRRPKKPKE